MSFVNAEPPMACTVTSAPKVSSISLEIESFIDAATTDSAATRATPIMRAAAVAPVRRGLRRAFSRLSRPMDPNSLG